MRKHFLSALCSLAVALMLSPTANADVVVFGSTTSYQEIGNDWQSMGTNDIDGSGGLGTDGFIFSGLYDGTNSNNDSLFTTTQSLPSYVTGVTAGADVIGTTYGNTTYGSYDNPNLTDGTDELAGFWIAVGGAAGATNEALSFTVGPLATGQIVRVGVVAGQQPAPDGRWDPTSISLSDGTITATVGDHATSQLVSNPGGSVIGNGWVFFDIDAAGTYSLTGTKRLAGQGAGISGVTFDSISAIPEPSSLGLLGLVAVGLVTRRRK